MRETTEGIVVDKSVEAVIVGKSVETIAEMIVVIEKETTEMTTANTDSLVVRKVMVVIDCDGIMFGVVWCYLI